MAEQQVRCLLMGGQACVFYGAAEFSRDSDFAILAEPENLRRLQSALSQLRANVIAVPPFDAAYLERGHAVHFRSQHPDCAGLRIDVMAVMRGVAPFEELWQRRTSLELAEGTVCHLLSISDLVRAKKTQRDKDWPMIRRLLEADYFQRRNAPPDPGRLDFWLGEMRTVEILLALAADFSSAAKALVPRRPLLEMALAGDADGLEEGLLREELEERRRDREYWLPLKKELESLRRQK